MALAYLNFCKEYLHTRHSKCYSYSWWRAEHFDIWNAFLYHHIHEL